MIHALNDISSSADIERTYAAATYFLNYAVSNPNAEVIHRASDMILHVDSDAEYLVQLKACSRAGGGALLR